MLVDVVVPVLDLMLEHAHDLVGNAVEPNILSQCVLAGEKLFLRVRSDHCDARVCKVVSLAEEAAFRDIHLAHAAIRGIHAADPIVRAARPVSDNAILEGFRRDPFQQRNLGADRV